MAAKHITIMKKRLLPALLLALLTSLSVPDAHAQFGLGGHVGIDVESDDVFLGAQARFGGLPFPLQIQPGVEFSLRDSGSYVRGEGNLLYFIGEQYTTTFTPYVGGGLSMLFVDTGNDSATDLGVNLLGGIEFNVLGPAVTPFAQARYTLGQAGEPLAIMGGLIFRFGGV